MKSAASFKAHPLHPILVSFPIAFLTGAFFADTASLILGKQFLAETGRLLAIAGIVAGLIAAVPGIIDYKKTIPPDSSAKKRATKHGLLNTAAILLFFIMVALRTDLPAIAVILIELLAVCLMTAAGWMGGTLVHRNQIGVDIRYAAAGKWKEEYFGSVTGSVIVASADELKTNQMKLIHVNGKRIVLARTEEGYAAFDDHCSHRGGSLAAGTMICGTVQCPWHGSQFHVKTGKILCGPGKVDIDVYAVREGEGKVYLNLNN